MAPYYPEPTFNVDSPDEPEDILSSSLMTIYGIQPATISSAGSSITYVPNQKLFPSSAGPHRTPKSITLRTPNTHASNWSLHASSIWLSSLYLVDHLDLLRIDEHRSACPRDDSVRVLELGAAAGLPGILLAKTYEDVKVTVSDYPDEELMRTLSDNVDRNDVSANCLAVPYAWGTDASVIIAKTAGFDLVLAADTLWNSDLHVIFTESLRSVLKKTALARVHLVAAFHTGRYPIESFLSLVKRSGFDVASVCEREIGGEIVRVWDVSRAEGETEQERRRWVIWIELKWAEFAHDGR